MGLLQGVNEIFKIAGMDEVKLTASPVKAKVMKHTKTACAKRLQRVKILEQPRCKCGTILDYFTSFKRDDESICDNCYKNSKEDIDVGDDEHANYVSLDHMREYQDSEVESINAQ